MTAKKARPLPPEIGEIFDSVAIQISESFRDDVLLKIIAKHPGKMDLPNDAYILLEMVICNIFLMLDVPAGAEAKLMKALTKNVIKDMGMYRLRVVRPEGSA